MTLADALQRRIPRIRKPIWANPQAYLRLPLLTEGVGPWAELYDDRTQRDVLGIRPGSQRILCQGASMQEEGYERYDGPVSDYEKDGQNYARIYAEE